jgi:hypothetical protein
MRRSVTLAIVVLSLLLPLAGLGQSASAHDADRQTSQGLLITYDGWGKLHRGMTSQEAQHTGMVSRKKSLCAGGYLLKEPYQSRAYLDWDITKTPWKVRSIIITGARDHTKEGTHPGTTLAQLRRQHPKLSKLTGAATLDGQKQPKKDLWVAWVTKGSDTLTYQFPYGAKPKAGERLDTIIVAKRPVAWFGC